MRSLPPKIVINRFRIVASICSKVFLNIFVGINREDKHSDQLVKFRFGSFCNTFSSSLVLGILHRVRKMVLPVHGVLLQPVKKSLSSGCCPRGAADLEWLHGGILFIRGVNGSRLYKL
jgi:hypothetical protein